MASNADSTLPSASQAPRLSIHGAFDIVSRLYPGKKNGIAVRLHGGKCQVGRWRGRIFEPIAEGASWDEVIGKVLEQSR